MAGPNLPVNVDSAYADSPTDPSVKVHQQAHDKLHTWANRFDIDAARSDGDLLAWDDALQLWVPIDPANVEGLTPVATTYATAAPGTVFRLVWNGTAWPAQRPSGRTDLYFDLFGGPASPNPTWFVPGDQNMSAVTSGGAGTGGVSMLEISNNLIDGANMSHSYDSTSKKITLTAAGTGAVAGTEIRRSVWFETLNAWPAARAVTSEPIDYCGGPMDNDGPAYMLNKDGRVYVGAI